MGLRDFLGVYKGDVQIAAAYRGETQIYGADVAPTAPGAFASGAWSVATGSAAGEIVVTVTAMPSSGGSTITGIVYRIAEGAAISLGAGLGAHTISGLTPGEAVSIQLAAINAVGQGAWSASKSAVAGESEAEDLAAIFGTGSITITSFGPVPAPSVAFGTGSITINS